MRLHVVITERSYEEREQYNIYDTSSFIADVGGYMGLMLGVSLMSMYNSLETLFKKLLRIMQIKLLTVFMSTEILHTYQ